MKKAFVILIILALNAAAANASPTFVFNVIAGTSQQAVDGFTTAANLWSSYFTDNVTVYLTIGFNPLGGGVIGQTGSTQGSISYTGARNALIADATSGDDATATAHLQGGSSVNMMINGTSNNPNGSGSIIPYLDNDGDANNSTIRLTTANAKAMGVFGANTQPGSCAGGAVGCDGFIQFNSNFNFDFDSSNGIDAGAFDFVGVAAHEIGHALGFISGVDVLDFNCCSGPNPGPFSDDQFTFVSALDLFRYSDLSTANGAIDWTADTRAKYFSLDGGATNLGGFSTGTFNGDGRQASHWKDNLGLGIMDPTAALGELLQISELDLRAFDVIGWNRASAPPPVPEVNTAVLSLLGLAGLALARRKNIKG